MLHANGDHLSKTEPDFVELLFFVVCNYDVHETLRRDDKNLLAPFENKPLCALSRLGD